MAVANLRAMNRYAAFVRGIMPGNPNMRSGRLREVFGGLGFADVGSVLASGNIVFTSADTDVPALESRLRQALSAQLGIRGAVLLRSRDQVQALVDSDPFAGLTHGSGSYLTATFLAAPAAQPPGPPPAKFGGAVQVIGYDEPARAVLAVMDNSDAARTPDLMGWLQSLYGKDITTRTWLTVGKVLARL